MRYYEDYEVGTVDLHGSCEVTREEIIEFASRYDPQDFHLDDEAAAKGPFGKLTASGWMTAGLTMRLMVESWKKTGFVGKGGAGMDELRWTRPVYPGDVLSVRQTLLSKRRSASRPEIGFVRVFIETLDAESKVVMSMISNAMIGTRDPGGTD
ncbi:MaoC family dehydratase [Croceicoccus bisphenolivorans]|uniref:MaoC family dehydratase n=1 Tax=Croceicoccus bisphenolivorans TaxID=1783232 RepID=UPI0008310D8A|nr:MaoC family dehydratase [Croceicoccus bisphenolivorans]